MIALIKAAIGDSEAIHALQIAAFAQLLAKYQDYDTNPGAETEDKIVARMKYPGSQYYFIQLEGQNIGGLRVIDKGEGTCRLSQVFILPAYRGRGFAQAALRLAEAVYPHATRWELDTIAQVAALCHLYEKLGYTRYGETTRLNERMSLVNYEKVIV